MLPTFLWALYGNGVHVITVNEYLVQRDSKYVGQVHNFLGLSVGLVLEDMSLTDKKNNYRSDITYLTNSELGFDFLRDNMVYDASEIVQRPFFYCVIDEVDSILIDESKTPLVISGRSSVINVDKVRESCAMAFAVAQRLEYKTHYTLDNKIKSVSLTRKGTRFCELSLNVSDIYAPPTTWVLYILNALRAKEFYRRNVDYLVNAAKEIIIVDEFTGRPMEGRRWGDGLHQAIEAKEGLYIQDELLTLASISYQSLFLLYPYLSGMSGTAETEKQEFEKIYDLPVVVVPPNKLIIRKDYPDLVYSQQKYKWRSIVYECIEMNALGRPVLIGAKTINSSDRVAKLLKLLTVR